MRAAGPQCSSAAKASPRHSLVLVLTPYALLNHGTAQFLEVFPEPRIRLSKRPGQTHTHRVKPGTHQIHCWLRQTDYHWMNLLEMCHQLFLFLLLFYTDLVVTLLFSSHSSQVSGCNSIWTKKNQFYLDTVGTIYYLFKSLTLSLKLWYMYDWWHSTSF